MEQSLKWNSNLYINFIDYEKAFDSVDKETLWSLLKLYESLTKSFLSSSARTKTRAARSPMLAICQKALR